jgi:hypothetical protein
MATEIKVGQIISVEQYNRIMERKWNTDCAAVMDEVRVGKRHLTELPQLAFYLFFNKNGEPRKRGYVLKYQNGSLCRKTKRECEAEKTRLGI